MPTLPTADDVALSLVYVVELSNTTETASRTKHSRPRWIWQKPKAGEDVIHAAQCSSSIKVATT